MSDKKRRGPGRPPLPQDLRKESFSVRLPLYVRLAMEMLQRSEELPTRTDAHLLALAYGYSHMPARWRPDHCKDACTCRPASGASSFGQGT